MIPLFNNLEGALAYTRQILVEKPVIDQFYA